MSKFTRNAAGQVLSRRYTDGTCYDYTYDAAGRELSCRKITAK
jgi:YD repeat-containing protein